MRLDELRRPYGAVISLGSNCQPAWQLDRLKLRSSSGPFDWILTHSLPHLTMLLEKRCLDFMDIRHLVLEGQVPGSPFHTIRDTVNHCVSLHDFPVGTDWREAYPEIKSTFDRRAERLFRTLENGEDILFVRLGGEYNEANELKKALLKSATGSFSLLLINYHAQEAGVMDHGWEDERVCSVSLPHDPGRWQGNDEGWDLLFNGISLTIR